MALDLFSRRIVGWPMSSRLTSSLTAAALEMAVGRRHPPQSVILHSDRCVQYASHPFQSRLAALGGVSSMSRTGNCLDNAVAQGFFGTLKIKRLDGLVYGIRREARIHVVGCIEASYN